MIPGRTELEWVYTPADFFEASCDDAGSGWTLHIEGGRAVATLNVPQDPVDEGLERHISGHLEAVCLVRNLQAHRPYELKGPRIIQHAGDKKHSVLGVGCAVASGKAHNADSVLKDSAGNVLRDTKAERVVKMNSLIRVLVPKATRSPELLALLRSYNRAISDPGNALVHLYEIRDALTNYCRGKKRARARLRISEAEWNRFDHLANEEPLEEGRHRGLHMSGRRNATPEELEEAQSTVRTWVEAFAKTL